MIPSGHQFPELLNAFNEALFVHDQRKKKEANDKAAEKLKRQDDVKSPAQSGVQGEGKQSPHPFKKTVLPPTVRCIASLALMKSARARWCGVGVPRSLSRRPK